MNRTEPYPLTPAMMHIATHPDNSWLKEYCEQYNAKEDKSN